MLDFKNYFCLSLFSIFSQRVLDEHAKYDDILQADMVDHYNNLTLKSVFTLKFFLNESNFNSPPPFHVRAYHMFLRISVTTNPRKKIHEILIVYFSTR